MREFVRERMRDPGRSCRETRVMVEVSRQAHLPHKHDKLIINYADHPFRTLGTGVSFPQVYPHLPQRHNKINGQLGKSPDSNLQDSIPVDSAILALT